MADHSIFPFAKKYGLELKRAGEAIYGSCLALLPDPPELDEHLQKQLTPLATLQKAPLLSKLIPTNLQMGNIWSKTVDGIVHDDDSPIVQTTVQSTGDKMVRMNESPKTVDGIVQEDDPPIVQSTVQSTGEQLPRLNKLLQTVGSVCKDKSPIVRSPVENQDHQDARTFRLFRDGKRYYGCTGCDFVKKSKAAVLGHIKRLSNADLDTCDCGYVTSNSECFRRHMLHCNNRFVCSEPNCEFTTTRKFALKRHLVTHSEQRFNSWKCDFCDETFTLKSNKKRHQQYFHMH